MQITLKLYASLGDYLPPGAKDNRLELEIRETDTVQAILEHQGQTFCLVKHDDSYETRRVQISSSNDKVVAIDEASTEPGSRR